jgi:hypothetical protein
MYESAEKNEKKKKHFMLNTIFTLNYGIKINYKYVRVRELRNVNFLQVKFVWIKQILIKFNIREFHKKIVQPFHMSHADQL